jgi:hypothetical protein
VRPVRVKARVAVEPSPSEVKCMQVDNSRPFRVAGSSSEEMIRKPINKKLATGGASLKAGIENVESTVCVEPEKL